jgi:hypothetical protein
MLIRKNRWKTQAFGWETDGRRDILQRSIKPL